MQKSEVSRSWHDGFKDRHKDELTFGKKHAIDPARKQWSTKWVRDNLFDNLQRELQDAGVVNRDGTLKTERIGNADETPMQYEGGKHMDHKGCVTLRVCVCKVCDDADEQIDCVSSHQLAHS